MVRIGNYELIDKYAVGGVAEIYRARHVESRELVVIKRMRTDIEFDPEHQAGFMRELQVALAANHKNLIRGLSKGTVDGLDYGVLEYIDGPDLHKLLDRMRAHKVPVSESFATYVAAEILDGLEFAWTIKGPDGRELGLVHRDLSPKNIFLASTGAVYIGDFGSSLASKVERVSDVVGTPGFMSPEQAANSQLDARSDVFAVGIILHEMLSGGPAIEVSNKTTLQLLKAHQRAEMRALPKTVDEALRMVVEVATSKDRDDRFLTPRAMRVALSKTEQPPHAKTRAEVAQVVQRFFSAELAGARELR